MWHSDDNKRRKPDRNRLHIYDTDQTDHAEPIGRSVWNGIILTFVLLGLGIAMMGIVMNRNAIQAEKPIDQSSVLSQN